MSRAGRPHPPEHEGILERALTTGDDVLLRELAACPICAAHIDALRGLADELTLAGHEQRDDVDRSRREAGPIEEEIVRSAFEAARAGGHLSGRAPARRWPTLVAALGLVAAGLTLARAPIGTPPADPPVMLTPSSLQLVAPRDAVDDFERFEWRIDSRPGWRVRLIVRGGDADGPVLVDRRVRRSPWRPPAGATASWPQTIHWTVIVQGSGGELVDSASATASR